MKRVTIGIYQIGLVFRKGDYKQILSEGTHWLGWNEEVKKYDKSKPFIPPCELNILLEDNDLQSLLYVIEVKDSEIVLQFEENNFKQVLPPGRYTYWKGVKKYDFTTVDLSKIEITENINSTLLHRREILPYIRAYKIETYEQGLLIIDGIFQQFLKPGTYYFWKNSTEIQVLKADLRQRQLEISGQELLTKDKAALRINFQLVYKVVDIQKALLKNSLYEKQLYTLLQLALRAYVGTFSLDELLQKKEDISSHILSDFQEKAAEIGVQIIDCGIRDIILPGDMKEIMNQVLVAEKKAQANIITRREETASTRSLLNTAKLMEQNEMLFKLKEMEYVEKIAEKINSISLSGGGQMVDQLREIFSGKRMDK